MDRFLACSLELTLFMRMLKNKKISLDECCNEAVRAFAAYLILVLVNTVFLYIEDSFLFFLFSVSLEECCKILLFSISNKNRWEYSSAIAFGSAFSVYENFFIRYTDIRHILARMIGFFIHSAFLLIYVDSYQKLKEKGFRSAFAAAAFLSVGVHLVYDAAVFYVRKVIVFSFIYVILMEYFRKCWKDLIKNREPAS